MTEKPDADGAPADFGRPHDRIPEVAEAELAGLVDGPCPPVATLRRASALQADRSSPVGLVTAGLGSTPAPPAGRGELDADEIGAIRRTDVETPTHGKYYSTGPRAATVRATLSVNGRPIEIGIEPTTGSSTSCATAWGLPAAKEACGRGECGACTVLVRGRPVMSCLVLAARADEVVTIEGLRDEARALREAFADAGAFQCGFCTPVRSSAASRSCARACRRTTARSAGRCRGTSAGARGTPGSSPRCAGSAPRGRAARDDDRPPGALGSSGTRARPAAAGTSPTSASRARWSAGSSGALILTPGSFRSTRPRPRAMPGVVAVLAGGDFPDRRYKHEGGGSRTAAARPRRRAVRRPGGRGRRRRDPAGRDGPGRHPGPLPGGCPRSPRSRPPWLAGAPRLHARAPGPTSRW